VVEKVGKLIANMDARPAQIVIEARIVEMNTSFRRELGIQWGGTYTGTEGTDTFAVNLPIISGTGLASGLLGFGYVKDRLVLDATLSALEDSGTAKILSSPKIRVVENQEAEITSETEIIVPSGTSTTTGGVTTVTVERQRAPLKLTVTPRAIFDGQVAMVVNTERGEFDFSKQIQGIPPLLRRTAKTQLIVKDEETIVIGGIFRQADSKAKSAVPWLSKIPILGWLFKRHTRNEEQNELLIFITPSIVKEARLSESPTL